MIYNHTQIGKLMIYIGLGVAILFTVIWIQSMYDPVMLIYYIVILLIIASFSTLNVRIDEEHLQIKFGYGIYKKRFLLKEIDTVMKVKNLWIYGWGIRYWRWPKMWIYNVSGYDAIEIILKNEKRYRIGTDQPEILEKELKKAIK